MVSVFRNAWTCQQLTGHGHNTSANGVTWPISLTNPKPKPQNLEIQELSICVLVCVCCPEAPYAEDGASCATEG